MKPWQVQSWIIPEASAEFVCQMEAVLEVYERAYDPDHPVVNLDESPRQLIAQTRLGFTDVHGVEQVDYEYERKGVADVYMIVEPKGGRREVLVKDNHNRWSYAQVIQHIAERMYPNAPKITLVEDNLSAHQLSALYDLLPPEQARNIIRRIELVRTPKHGSWLNIAELELSVLTRQGLNHRIESKEELQRQAQEWYEVRNDKHAKVDWLFTSKDARIKLKNLYPKV